MNADQKTALYAQVNANNPGFLKLLEHEREEAVRYLTSAADPVALHRAQGKVQFLDAMLNMLANAHKHLRK